MVSFYVYDKKGAVKVQNIPLIIKRLMGGDFVIYFKQIFNGTDRFDVGAL